MSQEAMLHADRAGPDRTASAEALPALTLLGRALLLMLGEGVSTGIGIGFLQLQNRLVPYFTQNQLPPRTRLLLLGQGLTFALVLMLAAFVFGIVRRRRRGDSIIRTMHHVGRRLAPFGVTGFACSLLQWPVWRGRDLVFLALGALGVLVLERATLTAMDAGPLFPGSLLARAVTGVRERIRSRMPRVTAALPFAIVCGAALGYAAFFGWSTLAWHHSVRSSFELAVENNVLYNLSHGNLAFKAAPVYGPIGSHLRSEAPFFAFLLAPIYRLFPRAETLLVVQSVLIAAGAVPLYLLARRGLGAWTSCVLALAYLLSPTVQGVNLYEFHYLPLGVPFLFAAALGFLSGRPVLGGIAALLAALTHEELAASGSALGLYLVFSGRKPREGLWLAVLSGAYFAVVKGLVMPHFSPDSTSASTSMYAQLLAQGDHGMTGVVRTVTSNPWYTAGTLVDENKLVFGLALLVPLAFIPLRRALPAILMAPAFFFTFLTTGYSPVVSIHYQYASHFTAPLFIATILVLAVLGPARRLAATLALALGTLACTTQYGVVFQRNTAMGGPIPYKFGMDAEGLERRAAFDEVVKALPPDAKVAGSAFVTPQISNRADAYSLSLGIFDADYLLFTTKGSEFVASERDTVTRALSSGQFGVVAFRPPFALAKRGYSRAENAAVLAAFH